MHSAGERRTLARSAGGQDHSEEGRITPAPRGAGAAGPCGDTAVTCSPTGPAARTNRGWLGPGVQQRLPSGSHLLQRRRFVPKDCWCNKTLLPTAWHLWMKPGLAEGAQALCGAPRGGVSPTGGPGGF